MPVIVTVAPAAPEQDTYLSDLAWISAVNGYGPVERDMSNGAMKADDGTPISLNGATYEKGLGTHAPCDIHYYLGGACTRFVADVGIDDAKKGGGAHVACYVFADGEMIYDSGDLSAANTPQSVDVDVTGVQVLRLVTEHVEARTRAAHCSWAKAIVRCGHE